MTDCHDWQVKFLASEATILARHYPLNSCYRYFKPWFLWLLFNDALFFQSLLCFSIEGVYFYFSEL